jgi:hypothetical protein
MMFQRFGPTLFAPPFSAVWQAVHFLNTASPASGLAAANNAAIGSSAGAASPPPSSGSTASIMKPGFSGTGAAKIESEMMPTEKTTNTTPSKAPISLLYSKESIRPRFPCPAGRRMQFLRPAARCRHRPGPVDLRGN